MWPELSMVHGKPRHSQSQGSIERANQNIENILFAWMTKNGTTAWSKGLKFVQFTKNQSLHSGIKCSPYEAMFREKPRVGLSSTVPLPEATLSELETVEDLEVTIERYNAEQMGNSLHEDAAVNRFFG